MPEYTQNARATKPDTGSLTGLWGDVANTQIFDLLDQAIGFESFSAVDSNQTLTIPDGVLAAPRALCLVVGGALTANRTLTLAPNTVKKVMIVKNATTGGFSIVMSQGSGANVTIPNGYSAVLYFDGAGVGAAVVNALDSALFTNLQGTIQTAAQAVIDHDSLANFAADEHVDHTAVSITGGVGISGGGDISANRALALDINGLGVAPALDGANDTLALYDNSEAGVKKATINDIVTAGGGGGGGSVTSVSGGTGLAVANPTTTPDITLDFASLPALAAPVGSDLVISMTAAGVESKTQFGQIPLSILSNDAGFVTTSGIVSLAESLGSGLDGGFDAGTNPATLTLTVDLAEMPIVTTSAQTDRVVIVDIDDAATKSITVANLALEIINGPATATPIYTDEIVFNDVGVGVRKTTFEVLPFREHSGTQLAFFSGTQRGQLSGPALLSPSTVSGTGDDSTINLNFTSVAGAVNTLINAFKGASGYNLLS